VGGTFQTVHTTGANVTEYVNTSLTEGTQYTYRVIAVNSQGESAPSGEASVTTRPQSPGNVAATAGNRRVDLTWLDRSAKETGFRIERHAGNGTFATLTTVAANATSFGDTAVSAVNTYTYRVIALSAEGDSEASGSSSAKPRDEALLAKLVVSPKSLKFGTVKLSKPKQKTLKLTNKGKEPVQVTVGTLGAPFAVTAGGGSFTLAPKGSRTVAVRLAPTAPGAIQGTLRIISNDPRALVVDVAVSGSGR